MYLVKAGFRYINVERVAMAEDAMEEPSPRKLPDGVLRVTICGGRTVDFEGDAAQVLRKHLGAVVLRSPSIEGAGAKVGRNLGPGESLPVDPPTDEGIQPCA